MSFLVIFVFLGLRYDFGNDYMAYLDSFLETEQIDFDFFRRYYEALRYGFGYANLEPGWILLCVIFKPFGIFAMVAALALFNCVAYYRFVEKYVPPSYYWFAIFLYVFSPPLMLIQSSAMRQTVAIGIYLFAIDCIYKKNLIRYTSLIAFATLFHFSAITLLPVYIIGLLNWKITNAKAVYILIAFPIIYFVVQLFELTSLLFELTSLPFMGHYLSRYELYNAGGELRTGLGIIYYTFILTLILFNERLQTAKSSILFKISVLNIFIIPIGLIIMMSARIGYYFQPSTMAVYSLILFNTKHHLIKSFFLCIIVILTLYSFYGFFQSDVWRIGFETYQSIFFI